MRCDAMRCDVMQCNAMQFNTLQCNVSAATIICIRLTILSPIVPIVQTEHHSIGQPHSRDRAPLLLMTHIKISIPLMMLEYSTINQNCKRLNKFTLLILMTWFLVCLCYLPSDTRNRLRKSILRIELTQIYVTVVILNQVCYEDCLLLYIALCHAHISLVVRFVQGKCNSFFVWCTSCIPGAVCRLVTDFFSLFVHVIYYLTHVYPNAQQHTSHKVDIS